MNQDKHASPTSISRRRMLQTCSVAGASMALAGRFPAYAMQAARTMETPPLARLNRFPRMVHELFVKRENEIHQQRLKTLAAVTTKADAEAYVATVRGKIRDCFGPYP